MSLTRVLHVEDSESDAKVIKASLSKAFGDHISVVQAGGLQEAIRALIEAAVPFDVVLLDLTLPDSVGVATLGALQPYAGETPIIVVTGLEDAAHAIKLQGAAAFVPKGAPDLVIRSLIETVQRSRQGRINANALAERLEAVAIGVSEIRQNEQHQSEQIQQLLKSVEAGRAESIEFREAIDGRGGVNQRLEVLESWRAKLGVAGQWVLRCFVGAAIAGLLTKLIGGAAVDGP